MIAASTGRIVRVLNVAEKKQVHVRDVSTSRRVEDRVYAFNYCGMLFIRMLPKSTTKKQCSTKLGMNPSHFQPPAHKGIRVLMVT